MSLAPSSDVPTLTSQVRLSLLSLTAAPKSGTRAVNVRQPPTSVSRQPALSCQPFYVPSPPVGDPESSCRAVSARYQLSPTPDGRARSQAVQPPLSTLCHRQHTPRVG